VTVIGGSSALGQVNLRDNEGGTAAFRTVYSLPSPVSNVTAFDPDKFDEKYVHYFEELQQAYSTAYNRLHGRYDSEILRAIDRKVLSESEPAYLGDGEFRVDVPDERVEEVRAGFDGERFDTVLEEYRSGIEAELARLFEFED
jgi:hypothetical protein